LKRACGSWHIELSSNFAQNLFQKGLGMELQPHQQRVVEERAELEVRIGKLQVFITSEKFADVPDAEQGRLVLQHHIMTILSLVLEQRIAAF
jgi:hypothetical protein